VSTPRTALVRRVRIVAWLALIVLSTAIGIAAESRWAARVWQSDDGLPNNNVLRLAQTAEGYVWITTMGGLARFDGQRFETYSYQDLTGAPDKRVRAICRNEQGQLSLLVDDRLAVLKSDAVALTAIDSKIVPQTLLQDAEGAYWFTYLNGSVARIKEGVITRFGQTEGLENASVSLTVARDGQLWFGQPGRIGLFRDGRFETLASAGAGAGRVCVAAARAGGIWVFSGEQLFRYRKEGNLDEVARVPGDLPEPSTLLEDTDGAVWLGTTRTGLFRYEDGQLERIPTSHRMITSLLEDAETNLWVGTNGGGLHQIRARTIQLLGPQAGQPWEAVSALCEDAEQRIWLIGQDGTVARKTGETWTLLSNDKDWPVPAPRCLASDRTGAVWFGSGHDGLYRLQNGSFRRWEPSDGGLACRTIRTLMVSRDGDLWIGGQAPTIVQRLRGEVFDTFPVPENLRAIRGMVEDARGDIWLATVDGVLLKLEDGKWSDRTPGPSGGRRSIRCIYPTADGSLWIGYAAAGLGRIKNGRYSEFRREQGLYDNSISKIVADGKGWLWLGADHGVFKVKLQWLDAAGENPALRIDSIHYGRSDGLASLQAHVSDVPGALRSTDGRLWLPMRSGLAVINPALPRENAGPPPVLIESVELDGKTIASNRVKPADMALLDLRSAPKVRVPPGHRKLEFHFTALTFRAPENVHFRYRLDGFDEGWTEAGTQRDAVYPQLSAGAYRFRVKACNSDGVWNDVGAQLAISVVPFFWQTWWFRLGAIALFTSVVVALVRYVSFRRLRSKLGALEKEAALYRERARIAKDIHDDLGGSLTHVTLLADSAPRLRPEHVGGRVIEISRKLQQVNESLDEIVWAVNPRNDTAANLINHIGQFTRELFETAGISCRLDLPERPPERMLSPEVRYSLFLVAKETLNNIVRHARASRVEFVITTTESEIRFEIGDDGQGFAPAGADRDADGIRNMRQRMADIGGQFEIESTPGAGTHARAVFYWPRGE
jgi:signal transduction histidine kinase/ligand-binding sensor domain-containing protein